MSTLTLAICARNAQDIIGPCLESITAQTVAPDRVVVAVDEDTDPTIPVAKEHGADIIVSNATGLYEARNAVLHDCTTDYLAFTDADCRLAPEWVALAKGVLDERPEIAAGTGAHPSVGERNLAAWLHHMWFLVETRATGPTDGVIGGNSYFRTQALRDVGGWLPLSGHSAAEDVYISMALQRAGHGIWFESGAAANHHYETRMDGLRRKAIMMGKDIVVMLRAAGWFGGLWWYTLAIPTMAAMLVLGIFVMAVSVVGGISIAALPLVMSFLFLLLSFRSVSKTIPRWAARWILIWPYSYGICKGLVAPIPEAARR